MLNNQRSSLTLSTGAKNYIAHENTKFSTSSHNVASLKDLLTSHNYSPIVWRNHRAIAEFSYATAASLDFDKGLTIQDAEATLAKNNLNYALITSKSHTDTAHRFRVIIPLCRKIYSPEDYKRIMLQLRDSLFPNMDPNAMDAARFFYHSPDTAYFSSKWDGVDYDPDQGLNNQIPNAWNDNLMVTDGKNNSVYANLVHEKTPIYCPFHDDGSPSAFIKRKATTEDRFIHCSACGKTYWKIEKPLDQKCERFWSHSTKIYEFGFAGESFDITAIDKEKFNIFVNAISREEKNNAMKYLLDTKHISHLKVVNHIGQPDIIKSDYLVDREEGTVTVRYSPRQVQVPDNDFIEQYLEQTFGDRKQFIKEWMAVYSYTNYKDLPTLILKGPRGSGKNTFAEMLYAIYPSLSEMWDGKRKNFTSEAEKKLLIADETVCDDPEQYKLLKEYAGQKFVNVNKKYQPPYEVQNNVNIIILSNAAIPVYVAESEMPTSDTNNQFFVYEFKPFAGTIDELLDKKLEDRIGHYVRTELKKVYESLVFGGNRYSIKVPITQEEIELFESNITEEETMAEKIVEKVGEELKQGFSSYDGFFKQGYVPTDFLSGYLSGKKIGIQKLVRTMQERGYLERKKAEKKQIGNRLFCYKMTTKMMTEVK